MKNIVILICILCLSCLYACGKSSTTSVGNGNYTVSGTVTSGGSALSGVTVTLSGAGTGTATTDSSGNYSFTGLSNGGYSVTPTKTGNTFTPASRSVTVSNANSTGNTFTASTAATIQLPKTGQTTSYATGDDGELQKGVASPSPRFTDNSDGTITDNLTGLIWLKNANCTDTVGGISKDSGWLTWDNALTWSNSLASSACGLTDGSVASDWRLPNITELESLIDLQNASGIALPSGHPFTGVQALDYWSSSNNTVKAWSVSMYDGLVYDGSKLFNHNVWPVRGGQ